MKPWYLGVMVMSMVHLGAADLAAQSWKGPASLRLEVAAYRGGPVAGAEVLVRTDRPGSSGGPPAVYTDAAGEVEIIGLAVGEWRVEVAHPSYMTFVATVRIAPEERAVALSTAHQAGEGSGGPMKVRLQRPKGRVSGANSPPEWALSRGGASAPRAGAPSEQASSAPERPSVAPSTAVPRAATAVPEPVPDVAPAPPSAAAPVASAPTAAPTVESRPRPAAEPVPTSAPAPTPAPAPAPVSSPEPAPVSPPTPAWDAAGWVRAAGPGGCLDCKPGEWSVSIEVRAAPVNGVGCPPALERGSALASSVESLDLSGYAGPATSPGAPWEAAPSGTGSCVLAAVAIPAGARFLGYSFAARDESGAGGCLPKAECGIGDASWDGDPRPVNAGGAKLFWAVFENRSGSERFGELKVWFAPPSKDWQPGLPIR